MAGISRLRASRLRNSIKRMQPMTCLGKHEAFTVGLQDRQTGPPAHADKQSKYALHAYASL